MIPKKTFKKYLYEFQVPISYKRTVECIEACSNDTTLPKNTRAETLMRIKRALESYRRSESQTSAAQFHAEQSLVERAAELGDKTAISLLCYSRLSDPNCTAEDKRDGSRLLAQLIEIKFPLSLKHSADLAYKMGHPQAAELYKRALALDGLDKRTRTECWRSIAHIAFKEKDLVSAKQFFAKACQESNDPAQVADCHFYLAQLRESDREVSRVHLERAAACGLSDSFLPLGMLLLNYFNDPLLAQHWLQLALVTDTTGQAALGLLDVASRTNNKALARSSISRVLRHKNAKELVALRPDAFSNTHDQVSVTGQESSNVVNAGVSTSPPRYNPSAGRWDVSSQVFNTK